VRSSKKFNVHLSKKSAFCCHLLEASAAPRPKNSDLNEKDALFGLDTQITNSVKLIFFVNEY
jgi:hypothetical protein